MPLDVDIARELAQQLRDSQQARMWRKVTTILSAFDIYRLTGGARRRISEAFAAAELRSEPSMMTVDRSARVSLFLTSSIDVSDVTVGFDGVLPVGVTLWERHETGWAAPLSPAETKGVLLVDVDLSLVTRPDLLFDSVPTRLRGLDDEALRDVLTPDHRASFKRAMPGAATRQASMFVVTTDENVAPSAENAVLLSLGLIEFAVGRDWLLVARHPVQTYISGSAADHVQAVSQPAERYVASLHDCGLAKARTSEAAALAVITQAVDSFGRARAELASYVDSWRTDFAEGSHDRSVLLALQATLPLVVDALEPLRRPTVVDWLDHEPRDRARDLTDHVDRSLDALRSLQATTADAIAQAQQHQNELYQGRLATMAAVLLAPGLVASIFGANQALADSPLDLIWLFIAMLVAGLVTNVLIRNMTRHRRH
jgi:Mg2+ and Co2+ transporter CorA